MSLLRDIKLLRLMRKLNTGKLDAQLLAATLMPLPAQEGRFADVVAFDTKWWLAREQKALR